MKLSELLREYGDDNYKFQSLDTSALGFDAKKAHTEIKFGTTETFHVDKTVKMGIVIWLDRDKVQQIMDNKNV